MSFSLGMHLVELDPFLNWILAYFVVCVIFFYVDNVEKLSVN